MLFILIRSLLLVQEKMLILILQISTTAQKRKLRLTNWHNLNKLTDSLVV
jgi:hypothetical protein